jgi:hypothetical protein
MPEDGLEREDSPRFERFRLVTEGPRGGRPLTDLISGVAAADVAPYKLFEKVRGAELEVHAAPDSEVDATLTLHSPLGRRFDYVARADTGADGIARLRVPYASDGTTPVRARTPWHVRSNGVTQPAIVTEQAVQRGETVVVEIAPGSRE